MQEKNINFNERSDFGNPFTGLRFQSVLWGGLGLFMIIHGCTDLGKTS